MEIKIESGIPIAPRKKAKGAALIYPFDKMNVNDSFEIPEGKKQTITVAAYQYAKRQKAKSNIIKFEVSGNRLHRTK